MAKAFFKQHYLVPGLRIFGAPVYLHISAIVVAGLLGLSALRSPIFGIVAITSYLSIILLHEAGHAFVARRLGLEVFNIQVGWFHGVCEYQAPPDEWRTILVAWGGVAAQLLVATTVLVAASVIPFGEEGYLAPVIGFLGYVNLMIALVNLAPVGTLDGATAWRIVPYLIHRRPSRSKTKSARDQARKKWRMRD